MKGSHQSPNFDVSECFGKSLLNYSCHFPNYKSKPQFWDFSSVLVFLRILHQSSVSWDINLLYFFSWNFRYFQQKKPFKVSIWWNFTWAVESLKLCTLMSSFYPAKSTEELSLMILRSDANFTKNWTMVSNMTWGIWWIFTQPIKNLKIPLW